MAPAAHHNVAVTGDLPSGVVTFVFTDIEGSTRLFRRLGDAYPPVLERHNDLLRKAWVEHGGYEVNTEGEGFFVAFSSASDAVTACVRAQRLLAAERWPEGADVRVRMGVHTGLAAPRNGDYVAFAVHQASRVVGAAHGEQIIVSPDARDAAGAVPSVMFSSLGRYRVRDFDAPVELHQVTAPGLRSTFPAVRATPAQGHNLTVPANTFVGREHEIADLVSKLGPGGLVSVVGPAGVGKTRLAYEVGRLGAGSWTDGVWGVDLAAVADSRQVEEAIASAIGVPVRGEDRWEEVTDFLRDRNALIVLDSTEVHVEACASLVPGLLAHAPSVGVLTTGREALRVPGEVVVPLNPLPTPARNDAAEAASSPAVRLFLDRAQAAQPSFHPDPEAMRSVVGICRRLDGLPLAIEIAAARTGVLDPASILAGLEDTQAMLRSHDRSLPARHRTIRSLFDWSHRLLSPDEQAAFRRLSVFGGGFTIEAARVAVADDQLSSDDVPELVWSLTEKSLVAVDLAAGRTRYRFLRVVRQYGRVHLDEAGETTQVAVRLSRWFLERLGPGRPADRAWIGDVGLEADNVRRLIPLAAREDEELAQQLACLVGRFLDAAQTSRTGIDSMVNWAATLVMPTPSRVSLLTTLAQLHLRFGDVEAASRVLREAGELRARVGSPTWDEVGFERQMGELAIRSGDFVRAAELAGSALEGQLSPRGRARMWNLLGLARSALGDLPGAMAACEQERKEFKETGQEVFVAASEGNLAEIALRLGDHVTAAGHQRNCLDLALALGQPVLVAYSLLLASRLAAAGGGWSTAATLAAKGAAMLDETGQILYDDDRRAQDELMGTARERLGLEGFAAALESGRSLDTPSAVSLAGVLLDSVAKNGAGPVPV